MILLLLACTPVEVVYLEGTTQTVYLYDTGATDGGDSEIPPGDSDPVTGDSAEDSKQGDSDSDPVEPIDADGDGYTSSDSDCDDTNASIHPGADDSSDDDTDNDCDGEIDEDYDACAAAFGWAELASTEYTFSASGSSTAYVRLNGVATICEAACDTWWLSVEVRTDYYSPATLPYFMTEGVEIFVSAYDPGIDANTGTCTITTSAGDQVLTLDWVG